MRLLIFAEANAEKNLSPIGFERFHYKPALDGSQVHPKKQYTRRWIDDDAIIQNAIEHFGNIHVVKILH